MSSSMARTALALGTLAALVAPGAARAQTPTTPDARLVVRDSAPGSAAQSVEPRSSAVVHRGKWVAAGLFAATMGLAVLQHESANNAFDDLRTFCRTGSCAIGPDGRYADAGAESIYQRVVSGDRATRVWLLAGQAAFVGTAALFILDVAGRRGSTNIPYGGLIVMPGRVGLRMPLP